MKGKYLLKEAKYYKKIGGLSRAIKKFILSQTIFSKIVNNATYNKLYYSKIKKSAKKDNPRILQIENTNLCNATCVMCPHTIMKREKKTMSFDNFKKILDNVMRDYAIKTITITGFGEPFLDKTILDKIKYVNKKYPFLKIEMYTNASVLNKDVSDELLKTNVHKITFSINSVEKKYKQIMGLDYGKTRANVCYFIERKLKLKHPIQTNVSLMILKENETDVQKFVNFWQKKSDSVRVYSPSDWAGKLNNLELVHKDSFKNKRWPCFVLWQNITIDVEGNVIMCCRDYESKIKFGNALKENVKEIRNSKKYQELLKKQMEFNFKTPLCSNCDNSFDSSLDWVC